MSSIYGIIDRSSGGKCNISTGEVYKRDKWTVVADASFYKQSGSKEEVMETLLNTWLKHGVNCVKELYGDFAFVIHNSETGEIFCARDHFGVRPFFYSFTGNRFIFGSLLNSVVSAMKSKPPVRYEYLLNSLVTAKEEKDLTPFENIYRLKPGHYLYHRNNKTDIHSYWQLDPEKRIVLKNENEYTALLREKLVKAVNMRCRGIERPGSELSGGLDSSAVTGIATRYCNENHTLLQAYSNVFPQGTNMEIKDELEFIQNMEGFIPFKLHTIDHLSSSIPELLQHSIDIQGCHIQQNFSISGDALYQAAGRDQIQVLLSGFGGDEMVSARTSVQWNELIRNREWSVIQEELFHKGITPKSLARALRLPINYLKWYFKRGGYTSGVFTKELLDRRFSNMPLQPDFALENNLRQLLGDQYIRERRDSLAMRQVDRIMHPHLPQRMEYCYAATSQYGIEYRYPLLDVDLVETYLAFPVWMKQHHGINRYAFRQAIKEFVPEEIRLRNDKSGSTIPQTYYSLAKERNQIMALLDDASRSPFLSKIFDFSKFRAWYEKLVKRAPEDQNYLMPGAFYSYLMMMIYEESQESRAKTCLPERQRRQDQDLKSDERFNNDD